MAKSKTKTATAAAFPAKASPKAVAKLADRADAQVKKPTRAKKVVAAKPPAVVAKAGKLLAADPKGVPGVKAIPALPNPRLRTVKDTGLASHEATSVAELAKLLADFPRGSTFLLAGSNIDIYNLRGKMIATIRQVAKPVKGAKK